MAKHRKREKQPSSPSLSPSHGLQRPQMRDPILDRSRLLARRSVRESLLSPKAMRNLMTEDLRHESRFQAANLPTQTYRRDDGGTAFADWREVDTNQMRKQGMSPRLRFEFSDPDRTLVCVRRKARRAVIFAMRKAGKNGKRNRTARWTAKSYISCRKGR